MSGWSVPEPRWPMAQDEYSVERADIRLCCLGEGCFDLALRASRAGQQVDLVIADAVDARRLVDMVAAYPGLTVGTVPTGGLCIAAPDWEGDLPNGAVRLGQDFVVVGSVVELCTARAAPVAQALGLPAVATKGGVASRMLTALEDMAEAMILQGAAPWELDDALEEAGFSETVFARQDGEGLDVAVRRRPSAGLVPRRMIAEGRLGRKVGVGWYRYPGNLGRVVDPLIEDLVREEARFEGVPQREICGAEAMAQSVATLMRAAMGQWEAGETIVHIDSLAVLGLGYPKRWAGPLVHLAFMDPMARAGFLERCEAFDLEHRLPKFLEGAAGAIS